MNSNNPEKIRIKACECEEPQWKRWGPYLAERQWGTVREDYSEDGDAWSYFPHDVSRSRAYRWGEDGIGGISDWKQRICFAFSFWNQRDSILKERLYGLNGREGNHGEDVKELYYYLDCTPTFTYMRMLYKYPQGTFPYTRLLEENRGRSKKESEYEILDTGIFDDNRYFDIEIEYAKISANDILIKVSAHNRGPAPAPLEIIPVLWFRNTWSWEGQKSDLPQLSLEEDVVKAWHPKLEPFYLHSANPPEFLFCDNNTNENRLFNKNIRGFFKDGINDYITKQDKLAVNPKHMGTKCGLRNILSIDPGESSTLYFRLSNRNFKNAFRNPEQTFAKAKKESDDFYANIHGEVEDEELRSIQRQALAGLLWSQQFYYFDVHRWHTGDPAYPRPQKDRKTLRNADWEHLYNKEIISMPDTWEYPWYAAWDLAFHCIPLAMADPYAAKNQLQLITREWYMHPNGQLPAYEWNFSDVNPPVHAWATWRVYQIDRNYHGKPDFLFLERMFHKLMLNFTWWVNRKDASGKNIYQGGFLGLDNIGVFDRSAPLPQGEQLNQTDATSWMAMYSLNLMRIALELTKKSRAYEDIASKFFEHFLLIARAMEHMDGDDSGLWDDEDEFFFDHIQFPDGSSTPLKIRSMVGLTPIFAVETLESEFIEKLPGFRRRLEWFLKYRPDLSSLVSHWEEPGHGSRRLLSLLRGHRMKSILRRMLDTNEFLSDYGIRALSKHHQDHPYTFQLNGSSSTVSYQPAESDSWLFGGNSNWRGPIWIPMNYLIIESLQKFYHYYGDSFKIEYPSGSGQKLTLLEISELLSMRLIRIFTKGEDNRRPVFGDYELMQSDPNFKDHILFYEYFHGDTGRGIGASHQTGWTALIAKLIKPRKDRTLSEPEFERLLLKSEEV